MDDLPIEFDLALYQGTDWRATITVRDPLTPEQEAAGETLGNPTDLTGWSGIAQIRYKVAEVSPGPPLAEFTITFLPQRLVGGEDAPTKGQLVLELTGLQTRALPKRGVWDFKLRDAQGFTMPYMRGKVAVEREVSVPEDVTAET